MMWRVLFALLLGASALAQTPTPFAFDFPTNPVVGQIYNGYKWDGEKWVLVSTSATCSIFTSSASGCVPASGGVGTNFLSADGTWKAVSSGTNLLPLDNLWTGKNTFTQNTEIGAQVAADSLLTINANTLASDTPQAGTVLHVVGPDGGGSFIVNKSFGGSPFFVGRKAGGTSAAKTAIGGPNVTITGLFSQAYDGAAYQSAGQISFNTAEAWDATHRGTYISFWGETNGPSSLNQEGMRLWGDGGLSVGSANVASDGGNGIITAGGLRTTGTANITIKPTVNAGSFLTLDTSGGTQQVGINFYDNGTNKWELAKQTGNSLFFLLDVGNGTTPIVVWPGGGINFANAGGGGDPGLNNVYANVYKSALGTVVSTIATGSGTLQGTVGSGACQPTVTVPAAGVLASDVMSVSFGSDPTVFTGFLPGTSGMLTIMTWPSAGNVNFKVCNNTAASITPGAFVVNWRVAR